MLIPRRAHLEDSCARLLFYSAKPVEKNILNYSENRVGRSVGGGYLLFTSPKPAHFRVDPTLDLCRLGGPLFNQLEVSSGQYFSS